MPDLGHIYRLGIKELWGVRRDRLLILLIIYAFSFDIYFAATAIPDGIQNESIGIVDEDQSPLSNRIASAFFPPMFQPPLTVNPQEMEQGMDLNRFAFGLNIPPHFQRDVLSGKYPTLRLNIDATLLPHLFTGSGYIGKIVEAEVLTYLERRDAPVISPVSLDYRIRFNPNLTQSWFGAIMEVINQVTLLSLVMAGAALLRERERGTLEHLLALPVTPAEILLAKVWSMGFLVLAATGLSIYLVVEWVLAVRITGSVALFLLGVALHIFATASLGIFLATLARSMPQFVMLLLLALLPMLTLSGGVMPWESIRPAVQYLMLAAPTTHLVRLSQAVLFRGATLEAVWVYLAALLLIGCALFVLALGRFRKAIN